MEFIHCLCYLMKSQISKMISKLFRSTPRSWSNIASRKAEKIHIPLAIVVLIVAFVRCSKLPPRWLWDGQVTQDGCKMSQDASRCSKLSPSVHHHHHHHHHLRFKSLVRTEIIMNSSDHHQPAHMSHMFSCTFFTYREAHRIRWYRINNIWSINSIW